MRIYPDEVNPVLIMDMFV